MKTRFGILLLACAAVTLPAFGQYTPYFTDQMQSYQSAYWTENYTPGYGNTLSFNYNSTVGRIEVEGIGSFISTVGVPDGTSSYSVAATVLGTSNTSYVDYDLYLHATSDADYYKSTGTFYMLRYYKAATSTLVVFNKRVGGATYSVALAYGPVLHDGDTISAMVNDNGDIAAYINNALVLHANDTSITSGQPGVGISNYYNLNTNGTTAGTAITNVQLGPAYRTLPGPVTTPTVSAYASHIDFQWPAVSDGNGAGIAYYSWYRNYQWVANTTSLTWSDTTVQPGDEYVYTFQVIDMQWNVVTVPITVSAAVAPAGSPNPPDGREIGVRPTGTYWGASGEEIDVLSGNVNYTVPLLKARGRTGWNAPFSLTYNSQNWRQDSGGLWNLGVDVGYGYGWKLMAGSILPVYSGSTLVYYSFTDATGAQYRLSINNGGIWSSPESVYLEYDSNVSPGRLYFRTGQFWVMGCTSAAGEPDQGTMYPTILEDTNGNQIQIQYMSSASARITGITDFRGSYSFSYMYDASANPHYHLYQISNAIGTQENYTFSLTNQTLQAPFSPYTSYGTTKILATVITSTGGTQQSFTYTSDNSAALSYAYLPYGGYLQWTYNNVSYTGGATYQQVLNRYLSKDGVSSTLYPFSHESTTANLHQYTIIDDPGGVGEKYWAFALSGANTGVATQFQGRQLPGPVTKTQNDLTWAQDSNGDLYIQSSITTLDPGQTYQAQKRTDQNVDVHGNITQVYQYAFNSLTSPARIYSYQYLTPNTTYHIYDRLTQISVSWGLGTSWTIVTNVYSNSTDGTPSTGPPLWDSAYATSSPRSNLYTSTAPSKSGQYRYNLLGVMTTSSVNGVSTTITPSSTNGYAVPSQVTTGSASETLNWNTFLGLTSATGQNGDQNSMVYDSWGRPISSTSPFGAVTTYSYATAPYTPSNPTWTKSTVNSRWTKTTLDGLGRTVKVETGDASGTKSQIDTIYGSVGVAAVGMLQTTSLPHALGAGPVSVTYTYDGIGRRLSMQEPDGASTGTYTYQGNVVTVTDPAGAWKKYTMDAFGRLTQVEEPNPVGGSYFTAYTYDLLDHLTGVSMPRPTGTQTRTFNYTDPTTGQPGGNLISATNPENGTVSYYWVNGQLITATDAKGQQKWFVHDSMGRVTQAHRYVTSGGLYVEDPMQLTTYYYDTNPFNGTYSQKALGRLAAVQYYGGNCASYTPSGTQSGCDLIQEWYTYSTVGTMLGKKVVLTRGTASGSLNASWTADNEDRLLTVTYPSWKGCSSCSMISGSSYTYAYDTMGRVNTLTDTVNTHTLISGMTYGVANEPLQMTSGYTAGVNSETRTYNGMFQMTRLQVGSGLDLSYAYSATQNNGKIISQSDAISGEQIAYTYDALNRLASAQTTQTGGTQWGQSYTYDGFGNLTDQTVIKGSAPDVHVAYNYLTNRQTGDSADYNGNIGSGYIYDLENRLVQPGSSSTAHYAYGMGKDRVWRGDTGVDEMTFWVGHRRFGAYQLSVSGSTVYFTLKSTRVYFGGELISKGTYNSSGTGDKVNLAPVAADRLGSMGTFYPYGVERPSATGNDIDKFTGYLRDAATGLDYANARYHQPGAGRFMTPDPYWGSLNTTDPGTFNRYAYVGGDPINRIDPSGLVDWGLVGKGALGVGVGVAIGIFVLPEVAAAVTVGGMIYAGATALSVASNVAVGVVTVIAGAATNPGTPANIQSRTGITQVSNLTSPGGLVAAAGTSVASLVVPSIPASAITTAASAGSAVGSIVTLVSTPSAIQGAIASSSTGAVVAASGDAIQAGTDLVSLVTDLFLDPSSTPPATSTGAGTTPSVTSTFTPTPEPPDDSGISYYEDGGGYSDTDTCTDWGNASACED